MRMVSRAHTEPYYVVFAKASYINIEIKTLLSSHSLSSSLFFSEHTVTLPEPVKVLTFSMSTVKDRSDDFFNVYRERQNVFHNPIPTSLFRVANNVRMW